MSAALLPALALAVCVMLHVSAAQTDWSRSVALLFGVLNGLVVVVGAALAAGQAEFLAVWLATYLLLAYGYVIGVFNLGESSRRIRLLIELYQAPSGAMTLEEILTRYNARMVVEARLGRLVAAGQLIERDGRYRIGNRVGLWIATIFARLTPLLVARGGGLLMTPRIDPQETRILGGPR